MNETITAREATKLNSAAPLLSRTLTGKTRLIVARIQALWLKALLLFSLCVACFGYGFSSGVFKFFPYSTISDAWVASQALLRASHSAPDNSLIDYETKPVFVPTIEAHVTNESNELILVGGGPGYLKDFHKDGSLAWLMDRAGNVRHTWAHDPSVWNQFEVVSKPLNALGGAFPMGIHLYDNGDLLVNYQGEWTFPFAVGMARFDKNSKLLWKKEFLTHHWFTVADDGRIFVPAVRVLGSPFKIGETQWNITSPTTKLYEDLILVLDGEGNVLEEMSMLDAIIKSGWSGLLLHSTINDDPLHLNDVQLVNAKLAASQKWLSAGDLLVSFRNINSIGVLDPKTKRFKWMSTGAVIAQHSPRFYNQGVLVLDNMGGNAKLGGTQLVQLDQLGRPTVLFPQTNMRMPEPCRTTNAGHLDIHRDGNRVLMTLTRNGAIWEVDPRTGEVTWEYMYVHPKEDGSRQPLYTAKYIYQASFLDRGDKK